MAQIREQEVYFFMMIGFAVCILWLIPTIFYLKTLQDTLKEISEENRRMPPANVWLLLIPLFNVVWIFFVVKAISESLYLEYAKYGIGNSEKPTHSIGMAMAILQICFIIPFAGLAAFICWILYWIKVNDCRKEIINIHNNSTLAQGEKSIFL